MAHLVKVGLIHGWVQQNHDGFPQKAGVPQDVINEIHGSWFDPSNPVVSYNGSFKKAETDWLYDEVERADLVLVLGTSLSGLTADHIAKAAAARSLEGRSLGMVMINLQQTPEDGKASLRIFGKTDETFAKLLEKLEIVTEDVARQMVPVPSEHKVLVPYDCEGRLSETERMWLDLTPGQAVKLTADHNIQGANQPNLMHIEALAPYIHSLLGKRNPCAAVGQILGLSEA